MSDWYQIESNSLVIQLSTKGAEMKRLFSKEWSRELLWIGDQKTWNRSAPILFPIVGKLKDDEYQLHGKTIKLNQHGFARDFEFKCIECSKSEIEFLLEANQETFKFYPFCFELRIRYKIVENIVHIFYFVKNVDRQEIYFSIGAHPAFETSDLNQYEITFEKVEDEFFRLEHGLVNWNEPKKLQARAIQLTKEIFRDDALIFKNIKSKYIDLINRKRSEVIRLRSNTPYWGIWGKDHVPFVCIEPWFGIGDTLDTTKDFLQKEGIISLDQGEIFGFSYSIEMKTLESTKK